MMNTSGWKVGRKVCGARKGRKRKKGGRGSEREREKEKNR